MHSLSTAFPQLIHRVRPRADGPVAPARAVLREHGGEES